MVAIKAALQGIEVTITRAILITLVKDINVMLGVNKDIFTIYDEQDKLSKQKTRIGNLIGKNTILLEKVIVELNEDNSPIDGVDLRTVRPKFPPIYKDDEVRASIQPIYIDRQLTINYKYYNKSKSKVHGLCNKLKLLANSDSKWRLHDLEYSYPIPYFLLRLVNEINRLKNTRYQEQIPVESYITQTFDNRMEYIHTADGRPEKSTICIRECQLDVVGLISSDMSTTTPEYDDGERAWTLSLEYQLVYNKPITLLARYPLLIFNRLIGKLYRTFQNVKPNKDQRHFLRTPYVRDLYQSTTYAPYINIFQKVFTNYLILPTFDTEVLPLPADYTNLYSRIFSILVILDDNDFTLLFNLNDLPEVKLKQEYYNYLMEHRERLNRGLKDDSDIRTLFHFELYRNQTRIYDNPIILEEDGTLHTEKPLEWQYEYRVTFSILIDPICLKALQLKNLLSLSFYKSYLEYLQKGYYKKINNNIIMLLDLK